MKTATSGLHTYSSFTRDWEQRSPSRSLEPAPFARPGISADFERIQGRSLLDAAAAGLVDRGKFLDEEAKRASIIRDMIEARKTLAPPPSKYVVTVENGEMSPRGIVGTVPLMNSEVASKHPLEREETKYYQNKDRVTGGGGLPLELTAEERDVAYFLQQFAKGDVDTANECLRHKRLAATVVDCHGNGALHYACREGCLEGAKFAQVLHIDLNIQNNGGMTPLHYAVMYAARMGPGGRLSPTLQWLVMQGADLSAKTTSGLTPQELATSIGATTVAEWLGMCTTAPKWLPSKETQENGGPGDAAFRAPFTTGNKTEMIPMWRK